MAFRSILFCSSVPADVPGMLRKPIVRRHRECVELDISIPTPLSSIPACCSSCYVFSEGRVADTEGPDIREAISSARFLFSMERYWEAHNVLEGLWREERGKRRDALQAIILVAAAGVKVQMGQDSACRGLLKRAQALSERLGLTSEARLIDMEYPFTFPEDIAGFVLSGQ
ncbi:DUF309 domain-containing protein [Thermogymnomonas acidicola]|nr:DUF309 domain-containing protein [Thermogymnomonas acidicola]